jgi:NADH pyrophosphatase NudC (nudix superfamily)
MSRSQKKGPLPQYFGKLKLALKKKRYREALLLAINAYHASRDVEDQSLETMSLAYMAKAIEHVDDARRDKAVALTKAQQRCSFCGKDRSAVRLMAGAEANICEECAARVYRFFATEKKGQKPKRK